MDLDRQSIEKRDFPIGRRGYDPAAVDAHLRTLASEVEELQRALAGRGADSLAASAGTQVQAIVAAAEVAAAEIESDANANAEAMRAQAAADAEKTRADAVARAQSHVSEVGRATATLLGRVEALSGETGALVDNLRSGATRLASDLASAETNMGELYDAASGSASGGAATVKAVAEEPHPASREPARPADAPPPPVATATPSEMQSPAPAAVPPIPSSSAPPPVAQQQQQQPAVENGDLDGARLVALNMALNGDSREQTDRYLAENYEVADRQTLLDEVYAAIEG